MKPNSIIAVVTPSVSVVHLSTTTATEATYQTSSSKLAIWHGSGTRDTARVLKSSTTTGIEELKKDRHLQQVNSQLLKQMQSPLEGAIVVRIEEAQMDEVWGHLDVLSASTSRSPQSKKQQ